MARPVVLVHGAWHGAWCWDKLTPHLDRAGVPWVSVDLPSAGDAADADGPGDVETVEAALRELPGAEPAVLVGHSRGGLVITEAGTHERVGHLVYLTALYLMEGQTTTDLLGEGGIRSMLTWDDEGRAIPSETTAADLLYNGCSPEDATWAIERLRHQDMSGLGTGPSNEAWRHRPTTYVVCRQDNAIPPDVQRTLAGRMDGATLEWDTDHSPFLGHPELVAALLVGLSVG